MEQNYLEKLIDLVEKEYFGIYDENEPSFGEISTLFIKKVFNKENTNLFIQLAETQELYLPVISAIFLLMYEKNYCEPIIKELNIGDILFNKNDRHSYRIEAIDADMPPSIEKGYRLSYKYIEKQYNKYRDNAEQEGYRYVPKSYFQGNNYIKIVCHTHKKYDFSSILNFLKNHLDIDEIITEFSYKVAIVCYKQELIKKLRATTWHKAIPYRDLTKDGTGTDNLPMDSLIYIASDYQTIREHIFDKGKKLEAVIFFDKYNDIEIISKDIREKQLKKCIFIGEDDLQSKNENLLKWRWTPEECHYFYPRDFPLAKIMPVYVENVQLLNAINKFITDIEEIEQQYTLQFSSLKYYAKKALLTVIPEIDDLSIKEFLFDDLDSAGLDKSDIEDYIDIFQDSYQDIIKQIEFSKNAKAQRIATINFDYLVVSKKHKNDWQQQKLTKKVLTYKEWKSDPDKKKKVLFLGLYGYSHYQTMKNSYDNIYILIYSDSYEQQAFESYHNRYESELEDEYHSKDRETLCGKPYPILRKESFTDVSVFFDDVDIDNEVIEKQRNFQREEILKKYIFGDGTFEVLPISRHVLIQQGDLLISEKLENVKVGDELRIYQNFNKDKLEEIATPKQKQAIDECKIYAELWKKSLINFYRLNYYYNKEKLLADLQNKGADITLNTLNNWLDMKDKSLFPTQIKNIIAISELVNDDKLKENLKEINKKRSLYRSIMIALGRDFSDAISRYISNNEKTDLLKNFPDAQIQKMLKENIRVRKLVKITEPNAEEQFEQISLIFEDNSAVENNENHQPLKEEDNMTNEEFQELIQESEKLAEQAKEQADSLDESVDNLESDISNKLDSIIAENSLLKDEVVKLKENLQEAESQIDSLAIMQKKHHEAIKYLLDSFKKLNAKVDNLRNSLK